MGPSQNLPSPAMPGLRLPSGTRSPSVIRVDEMASHSNTRVILSLISPAFLCVSISPHLLSAPSVPPATWSLQASSHPSRPSLGWEQSCPPRPLHPLKTKPSMFPSERISHRKV